MTHGDADVEAVTRLVADCELADEGKVEIDREDILVDWARPEFDLATDSVGVFEHGRLIAEAEVFKARRAEVNVHPEARGRGIGTHLLAWTEDRARAGRADRVSQTVTDANEVAAELFARHGYRYGHTSWVLQIEHAGRPSAQLPDGYAFRGYDPGADPHLAYRVIEDAFNEWEDREPATFEDWAAITIERPSFEPWHMVLVDHVETRSLVGVSFLLDYDAEDGWIQQVATRADHRHRGLARAMLQRSFEVFFDRGKEVCGLSTDSRTGAFGLYEKVGMHVIRSYTNRAKELR
jgi:ribosomal protein S18 acetylase RimI-like enzyme